MSRHLFGSRGMALWAGLVLVGGGGCIALPSDLDGQALIACSTDEQCPPDWVCRAALGRCLPEEGLDVEPPGLAEPAVLAPSVLGAGSVLTGSFVVSEALLEVPTVELQGVAVMATAEGDLTYTFTWVGGPGMVEGDAPVTAQLTDTAGLDATVELGEVRFDFTAPGLSSGPDADPDDGWLAATEELRVAFTVDESLPDSLPPRVALESDELGDLELVLDERVGDSYTFVLVPEGDEPEGIYTLGIDLVDEAGNASRLSGAAVELDFTAPELVAVRRTYAPGAGNALPFEYLCAATTGTTVSLLVEVDEEIDPGAEVTLDLIPFYNPLVHIPFSASPFVTTEVTRQRVEFAATVGTPMGVDIPTGFYGSEVVLHDLAGNQATFRFDSVSDPDECRSGRIIWVKTERPVLQVDQSKVTWILAPFGTSTPEVLGAETLTLADQSEIAVPVTLPSGPYQALLPGDPLAPTLGIEAEAFRFRDAVDPMAPDVEDPVALLNVYPGPGGPVIAQVSRIGPAVSGAGGGVTLASPDARWMRVTDLPYLPIQQLFVSGVDAAGNVSTPVQVRHVEYVAHPGTSGVFGVSNTLASLLDADGRLVPGPEDVRGLAGGNDPSAVSWEAASGHHAVGGAAWHALQAHDDSPFPLEESAVVYDPWHDEVVVFAGAPNGTDQARTWVFDGERWRDATPASGGPMPRQHARLVFDRTRGRVVLFGGSVLGLFYPRDIWEWDGATWTDVSPLQPPDQQPPGREEHVMAYDPVGRRVLVYGGAALFNEAPPADACGLVSLGRRALCDLWEWNGKVWGKVPVDSAAGPGSRVNARAAFDEGRGRWALFGGQAGQSDRIWEYDPAAASWSEHPLSAPLSGPGPAVFFHPELPTPAIAAVGYDPGLGRYRMFQWDGTDLTELGEVPSDGAPSGRDAPWAVFDRVDGEVVLLGGALLDGAAGDGEAVFSLGAAGWRGAPWYAGVSPPPASQAGFAADPAGGAPVLFGGGPVFVLQNFDEGQLDPGLWRFGPAGFEEVAAVGGWPTPRVGGSLAADLDPAASARLVLFGGLSGFSVAPLAAAFEPGTWAWDGDTFVELSPAQSPPLRFAGSLAPSPGGGLVLFGGVGPDYLRRADTWRFTSDAGPAWVPGPAAPAPPPRAAASLAYDPVRDRTVLFGGFGLNEMARDDTWEWDGAAWRALVTPTTPPPRGYAQLAFDPVRERIVLHGGLGDSILDDTWELDGEDWVDVSRGGAGLPRFGHGVTWDAQGGRLLTTGGQSATLTHQSTVYTRRPPEEDVRPAILFAATGVFAPHDEDALQYGRVRARCSGTYALPDDGATPSGAVLYAWDIGQQEPGLGGWRALGRSTTGAGEELGLIDVTVDEVDQAGQFLLRRDRSVAVQCRPAGTSPGGAPEVAASFFEVRLGFEAPVEADCANDVDDDNDGATDCADLDCACASVP